MAGAAHCAVYGGWASRADPKLWGGDEPPVPHHALRKQLENDPRFAAVLQTCHRNILFTHFAASPPTVKTDAAAVTMVWSYIAELIFNMLILVGSVKMADRIVREMMGL